MASEINFIREVEKRECLYNHTLPEYNRRDVSEQAWAEVARNRNLTVNECKEKWRNIRSSLLRSLKKSDKVKKPYYLSPYLQFVVPYTKFSQEYLDESQREDSQILHDNELEIQITSDKFEAITEVGQNPFEGVEVFDSDMLIENVSSHQSASPEDGSSPIYRTQRRHNISRHHDSKRFSPKRKSSNATSSPSNNSSRLNYSSMRYFLLSLLPDFETMSEEQIRMFKIKVMMLIDDIKANFSDVRQNTRSSNDTERLQKRLINLLLRNLKNTS